MYKKNIKLNVKIECKNSFLLVSDIDTIHCIKRIRSRCINKNLTT